MPAISAISKTNTSPLERLRALVADDLQRVDQLIFNLIKNKISLIPDISAHTIMAGGKRLRPILTLASARMCNYQGNAHIDLAACVEFIHTATLLHDDVVDKSELRRGLSTANQLWGNKESILVGDFLLGKAFELMGAAQSLEIYRILSNASVVISEGEVMQLAAVGKLENAEERYLDVVRCKTAELFAAACEVGAVLAGCNPSQTKALRDYGMYFGIAFQMVDDALDYTSQDAILGKQIGDDFKERKITLPVILAYQTGSSEEKAFWQRTMVDGAQKDGDFQTALDYMLARNIGGAVTQRAEETISYAHQSLTHFPESPIRGVLKDLLHFAIYRSY